MAEREVDLEIDSRVEEITRACLTAKDWCRQHALSRQISYHVELCLDEILNNLVEHHYSFEPGHAIQINLNMDQQSLTVMIRCRDQAVNGGQPRFQEARLPAAEQLEERGYGCFLVQNLMNEVSYSRADGAEQIVMTKHLYGAA